MIFNREPRGSPGASAPGQPRGIKIQKKHRFSYTGKSIFVTVTEATRTPDFNGNGCFSAVSEATQAPWPLFCARIGVPIRLFCTFFFAKAPGGYANSGAKKGDPPKIFHESMHRFPRQQLSATLAPAKRRKRQPAQPGEHAAEPG